MENNSNPLSDNSTLNSTVLKIRFSHKENAQQLKLGI